MLFNSLAFLLFLPSIFFLYWFVFNKSIKAQNFLLLIGSYFFYGFWSWKFLGLLALSTLLDFFFGFYVASSKRQKAKFFLGLSLFCNLGLLGLFKYYNFFILEFQSLFYLLGLNINVHLLNLALPVGISFYTFHGMSYIIDIYFGNQKPVRNILDYAVFVSFFPLLVAGPIERANHLLPQVQKIRVFNYCQAVEGGRLILWGLFKKIFIADSLAGIADSIFGNYEYFNSISLILGAIAFSIQIYCDFSGYSDIAIGVSKLLGFEVLSNFKFPYFSRNIAEFWRRWHISLSSWFKSYLYIPLGGSKNGIFKTVVNTFIIFIVSGFWHGANWTFIIWGSIHAFCFLPFAIFKKNKKYITSVVAEDRLFPNLKEIFQMAKTFGIVTLAWIFFRSENIDKAFGYLTRIVSNLVEDPKQFHLFANGINRVNGEISFLYIFPLLVVDWIFRKNERSLLMPRNILIRRSLYAILIIVLVVKITSSNEQSFIYFQF